MDCAVQDFKNMLHKRASDLKETSSIKKCDVILYFCPITSRAGTDIDAAMKHLNQMTSDLQVSKPAIIVVFHITFDPDKIIFDSEKNIKQENTYAVDCLFCETGGLLTCQKNEEAIKKTANHFRSKKLTSFYCLKKDDRNISSPIYENTERTPLIHSDDSSAEVIQRQADVPRQENKLRQVDALRQEACCFCGVCFFFCCGSLWDSKASCACCHCQK
ncbi:uncharacterized protein si:dkey-27b3.4 [Danio aesculapii]|uniref:uncharacterized protein si:dkey-27b3.4 n=1 Tax=Danio aesculapii TaxID=1142201 RepID=UPI0024C03298|nr:uncharacterized protein si:dkey-27b3.4 [Danio aesculapii]